MNFRSLSGTTGAAEVIQWFNRNLGVICRFDPRLMDEYEYWDPQTREWTTF